VISETPHACVHCIVNGAEKATRRTDVRMHDGMHAQAVFAMRSKGHECSQTLLHIARVHTNNHWYTRTVLGMTESKGESDPHNRQP
jgi:hypothetical protein